MRFSVLTTSMALCFAATAWTAPTAAPQGLVARDDTVNLDARAVPEDLHMRDIEHLAVLDVRKAKWEKVKVKDETGKAGKGGKLKQNEKSEAEELSQKALYQAGCSSGTITYRWHQDGSQDPEEHLTVDPEEGDCVANGQMHIHRDGSWTQGPGGNTASGDGQV
jgi:hypothetical protein